MARILLVDDDVVLLKLYSTKLLADGHEVMVAGEGDKGLSLVESFKPNVIVLDLLMPKLNGFSFIEAVKAKPVNQQLPIIVFSSVANQEQIDRLKSMGVNVYLNKVDTTPTQLVTVITSLLKGGPPPQ